MRTEGKVLRAVVVVGVVFLVAGVVLICIPATRAVGIALMLLGVGGNVVWHLVDKVPNDRISADEGERAMRDIEGDL